MFNISTDSDMDDIFDNSDESAFEPDDSDDDFGQNSQESSSGDVDEEISQEPAPKPKPKPNPKPTPVEKPDVDNSWKKTGIEDKTLLAFAFVGNVVYFLYSFFCFKVQKLNLM